MLHVITDAARIRTLLIKSGYVRGQVPNAPGRYVPDGGSTVSLLGCALLGLAALRRKLRC